MPHYGVTALAFILQRIIYKLATIVYKSHHGQALLYLVDDCQPTAQSGRHHLCSADTNALAVPQTYA